MKVLHTSDWHIGKTLYGKKRYEEHAKFLEWLVKTIEEDNIDVLLIAGDVFDTLSPSNRAQELYYQFLHRIAASACRHVVVIGGNHDSASFLNAPRELLKVLDVHVIGSITEHPEDEILLLKKLNGTPELIICAVPFLRDRDIRLVDIGESIDDKDKKLKDAIIEHYKSVALIAERIRIENQNIPMIGMGHLFTAGGKTMEGEGLRDLYVGSIAHISADLFPDCFDYLALGHLHVPQIVGGKDTFRYSGSPLPMGFGEATQQKIVCIIELANGCTSVEAKPVPIVQSLKTIKGDWSSIINIISQLIQDGTSHWLEIEYTGSDIIGDLREKLEEETAGSNLEILSIKNKHLSIPFLQRMVDGEMLPDLNEMDVFSRRLDAGQITEDQKKLLWLTYQESLAALYYEKEEPG